MITFLLFLVGLLAAFSFGRASVTESALHTYREANRIAKRAVADLEEGQKCMADGLELHKKAMALAQETKTRNEEMVAIMGKLMDTLGS